jgi:four helix bundle protein
MQPFRELKVWQKAHQLTLAVYRSTAGFPREDVYGLTDQLRRACSSIGANLAEGCGRNGSGEFRQFCSIAMGSASEVEYHLLLAKDLKLLTSKDHESLAAQVVEVKQMLAAFMRRLRPQPGTLKKKTITN